MQTIFTPTSAATSRLANFPPRTTGLLRYEGLSRVLSAVGTGLADVDGFTLYDSYCAHGYFWSFSPSCCSVPAVSPEGHTTANAATHNLALCCASDFHFLSSIRDLAVCHVCRLVLRPTCSCGTYLEDGFRRVKMADINSTIARVDMPRMYWVAQGPLYLCVLPYAHPTTRGEPPAFYDSDSDTY